MSRLSADVDRYIEALPPDRATAVRAACEAIVGGSPGVRSAIDHGMPFFTLDGQPYIAVANQKHHVSIYVVGLDGTLAGRPDLASGVAGIDRGRNCLRFSKSRLGRVTGDALGPLIEATYGLVRSRGTSPSSTAAPGSSS
jgi:hypothetical protein